MTVRFIYLLVSVIIVASGVPLPRDFEDNIAEESVNTQLVPKIVGPPFENKDAVFVGGNGESAHTLHITPVYAEPGIFKDNAQTTTAVAEEETVSTTESSEGTTGIYSNNDEPKNDIEKVNSGVEVDGLKPEHSENLELREEFEDNSNFESEQIQEEVNSETAEGEGSDESIPVEEVESDGDSSGNDFGSAGEIGSYEESEEKFGDSYEYSQSGGSDEKSVRKEDLRDVVAL